MKAYLLTAASAFALGAGTAQLADFEAKASWADTKKVVVSKDIPSGNAALVSIWDRVDTAMCGEAEAQMGWDPDTCSVEPGTVLSITKGSVDDHVSVSFAFATTSTKGAPE